MHVNSMAYNDKRKVEFYIHIGLSLVEDQSDKGKKIVKEGDCRLQGRWFKHFLSKLDVVWQEGVLFAKGVLTLIIINIAQMSRSQQF